MAKLNIYSPAGGKHSYTTNEADHCLLVYWCNFCPLDNCQFILYLLDIWSSFSPVHTEVQLRETYITLWYFMVNQRGLHYRLIFHGKFIHMTLMPSTESCEFMTLAV